MLFSILGLFIGGVSRARAVSSSVLLSGGYAYGDDSEVFISRSEGFDDLGSEFDSGGTIYFKIESSRLLALRGRNFVYLLDSNGNKTNVEARLTMEAQGVFRADLDLSGLDSGLYFVQVAVEGYGERRVLEKISFTQQVMVGGEVDKLFFKQTDDLDRDSLGVGDKKEVTFQLKLDEEKVKDYNFFVNDFKGDRQKVDKVFASSKKDFYEFNLDFSNLNLSDDRWYFLSYDLSTKKEVRYRGGKLFFVDFEYPEAVVTTPEAFGEVSGVVDVLGTTRDAQLLQSYWLEVEAKGGEPILLGEEQSLEVIDDKLGEWLSEDFDKGDYVIRLQALDYVGNKQVFVVEGLSLGGFSNKFLLKTPKKVKMTDIDVATYPQVSKGSIGSEDGSGGIEVEDDRGVFTGWSVTGSFSSFSSDSGEVIGIDNLTVFPREVQVLKGQTTGVYAGGLVRPSEGELVSLMYADVGYGNGKYFQQVLLDLNVPSNPVADKYSSTIVITLQ